MHTTQDAIGMILKSPLFDPQWYLRTYPEVGRSGLDPAWHYLWVGSKAGYNPGPAFDAQAYLTKYREVAEADMNPLIHYETYGRRAGCTIIPADPAMAGMGDSPPAPAGGEALFEAVQQTVDGTRAGLGFTRRPVPDANLRRGNYTVVTPTGDRPAFFNRCMHMVTTQTLPPRQWVVVDDGQIPLSDQMHIPDWITYTHRPRHPMDPPHTLSVNMLAALEHINQDCVLVMEDDDWYAPLYAEFMLPHLDSADLVGLNKIRYYHLQASMWKTGTPPRHTAFAQSAFRRGHAWDHLAAVCQTNFTEIREKGVLDRHWWHTFEGKKHLIEEHPCLHVGFKGVFGRPGLADGHRRSEPDYIPDPDHSYLQQCIGPDMVHYKRWQTQFRKPYALYTVVTPQTPLPDVAGQDLRQFDLYAFSDAPLPPDSPWQALPFDSNWDNHAAQIAKCQALPHLYFPEHSWSLWVSPGTALPTDPAGIIAGAIDQKTAIAAPITELADAVPPVSGSVLVEYLKQRKNSGSALCDARLLVRQHADIEVARAMALWQNHNAVQLGKTNTNLSCALWQACVKPALLDPIG